MYLLWEDAKDTKALYLEMLPCSMDLEKSVLFIYAARYGIVSWGVVVWSSLSSMVYNYDAEDNARYIVRSKVLLTPYVELTGVFEEEQNILMFVVDTKT